MTGVQTCALPIYGDHLALREGHRDVGEDLLALIVLEGNVVEGNPNAFIRLPFFVEGMTVGAISGVLATVVVGGAY